MISPPPVFLGLGSNVGGREENLGRAAELLEEQGFRITGGSAIYETEPVGGPPQRAFLNSAVRGETSLAPEELLSVCLRVERDLGRVRRVRYGPRTLDIDILLYGDLVLDTPRITVPHPRLHERRFVLVPLAEVGGDTWHPLLGLTVRQLLDRCADNAGVSLYHSQPAQA